MNVRADIPAPDLRLPSAVLDVMMPMHVSVDAQGRIRHAGPTIAKMLGGDPVGGDRAAGVSVVGQPLLDVFDLRRPAGIADFAGLMAQAGLRLSLAPRTAAHLPLRGVILPLPDRGGAILDLSLGLSFARAVADFSLTLPDFSPCDQIIELLYLHEANSSTARLSRHLSERLQAAHASAQHQARTDALTGLSNRRAMDDELEHLLTVRRDDFTLLHLDLDLFKTVNDTYGHAAGDAVLVEVGHILDQEMRRNDFPARVGGDEFLIVLRPRLETEVAGAIATRLIKRIEQPIRFENHICKISASIGIVSTKHYSKRPSIEQMMADVDAALYQAKNGGRGRFAIFDGGDRRVTTLPGDMGQKPET
ncbi:MAG: diguanylate cyclase [Roseicyclus sp.]|nr:diguanylate cyclase [Roseicyclus sp.]